MLKLVLFSASFAVFLAACNLTKEVKIDLPDYESQPVVECYLENGQPLTLLLTKSSPFFEPLGTPTEWLNGLFLDSATVVIIGPDSRDTLANQLTFNPFTNKFYNYSSPKIFSSFLGETWKLEITLKDGKQISGQTVTVAPIKIDSIVTEWLANDTLARVLTYTTDDLSTANFYRRTLHESALDSLPLIDFLVEDNFFSTEKVAYGTLYEFAEGDTVFNTLFHLEKPYFDYLNTLQIAVQSNGNPFAQPAKIQSNVSGSANPIGIFTNIQFDRVRTIIAR